MFTKKLIKDIKSWLKDYKEIEDDDYIPEGTLEGGAYMLFNEVLCSIARERDTNNADHPSRYKAIKILEAIADKMGVEDMFDCKDGDTKWYDFEDMVVEIIEKGRE